MPKASDLHPSYQRMLDSIAALLPPDAGTGTTAIGLLLGESPQKVGNWRTRGVSVDAAIGMQRAHGINAVWLLYGEGQEKVSVAGSSHLPRPDGATISAAIELGRKSLLLHDDETFDPEEDGEIVAQAYQYLLARGQTKVTRSNVVDFAKALRKRQGDGGAIGRGAGAGQAGGAGGSARKTGRAKAS